MKKKIIIYIFLISFSSNYSQTFNKTYKVNSPIHSNGTYFNSLELVSNAIFLAGSSFGNTPVNVLPLLCKIDLSGDTIWSKKIIVNQPTIPGSFDFLEKISENKWMMWGNYKDTFYNVNVPNTVLFPSLYIFDSNGNSIVSKVFIDSLDNKTMHASTITSDKSIVIIGVKVSSNLILSGGILSPDSISLYITKFDTLENEKWTKTFFKRAVGDFFNLNHSMISSDNGSVIISGFGNYLMDSEPIRNSNYFIKIDSSGNVIWKKNYRLNDYLTWYNTWITNGPRNSCFFVATMASLPPSGGGLGNAHILLGQMDSNGDTLWTKIIKDTSNLIFFTEPQQIQYKHNQLYILGKYYWGYYKPMLMILDTMGNIQSYRRFEGPDSNIYTNELFGMQIQDDKSIVMTGRQVTYHYDSATGTYPKHAKGWVVKTDSFGCVIPGCEIVDTMWYVNIERIEPDKLEINVLLYPNPTTERVTIDTELQHYEIEIIGVNGQLIHYQKGTNNSVVDLSQYKSGLYLVKIIKGNSFKTYRIVKE